MFRQHLLMGEILMGLLFVLLSIYDVVYPGDYVTVGQLWRASIQCRVLSFLSMLSLEMTLSIVLIIEVERLNFLPCVFR